MVASSSEVLTCVVRDAEQRDLHFILDSWLKSLRSSVQQFDGIQFNRILRRRFDMLYERGAELRVAVDPIETQLILGWICAEPPALHYVYVKEAYRRQGLMWTMMAACGFATDKRVACTHWTHYAEALAERHPGVFRRCDLY